MSSIKFSLICKCIIKQTVMQYLFSVSLSHEDKIASVKYVYVNKIFPTLKAEGMAHIYYACTCYAYLIKSKSSIKRP